MSITLFGSCRLDRISNHNNLNNLINYCHSTKEVIQFIKFLKGEFYSKLEIFRCDTIIVEQYKNYFVLF